MGQALVDQHFGHQVRTDDLTFHDDDRLYRLVEDDETAALNGGSSSECQPRPGEVRMILAFNKPYFP